MLRIEGDLRFEAPSGGYLHIEHSPEGLLLQASDNQAILEGFQLLRTAYPERLSLLRIWRLTNPLAQQIFIRIGSRQLLSWSPGQSPSIRSLGAVLSLLWKFWFGRR
ncbi:MAG: hypothetical protein AAGI38_19155 [Bacteroidota bacterium]